MTPDYQIQRENEKIYQRKNSDLIIQIKTIDLRLEIKKLQNLYWTECSKK